MGLCERLVDVGSQEEGMKAGHAREAVLEGAVEMARAICEGGPGAIRAAIRAAGRGEEAENQEYQTVVGMEDRNEALRAFGEKRRPVFKGV
jgi:methylglutaconyl-CoA hydratase